MMLASQRPGISNPLTVQIIEINYYLDKQLKTKALGGKTHTTQNRQKGTKKYN